MKQIHSLLIGFSFFFSLALYAAPKLGAQEGVIEIKKGEKVYFYSSIVNPKAATFIMLPGIYRGLQKDDAILKIFKKEKINFVAVHFSAHPNSVLQLTNLETPIFFAGRGLASQMLADEVAGVVKALEIAKPIPVSLSYSGTVTQFLNPAIFPLVIETAPLGAFGEDDPQGTAQRKAWADWLLLWPGNYLWVEAAKDKAYRDHWSEVAAERVADYPGINETRLVDGYVAMARAIENYDIRKQDFKTSPKRIWILAEGELEYRRELQDQAVKIYNKAHKQNTPAIVIPGAGHAIPMDQPKAYAEQLIAILKSL